MPGVAQRLRDDQRRAVLALSPGERVALALCLGARDLESFRLAAIPSQTVAEARRTFDALAEGGKVTMPFEKTFWAEGFGMLVDRFGTPWMVGGQLAEA